MLEFKHLKIAEVGGKGGEEIAHKPREELRALPAVARLLAEAET